MTLQAAHRALHRAGLDLVRYPGRGTPLGRRARLLAHHRIDLVFDVGANVGQYGRELRDIGYRGRIVSFEPLLEAFAALTRLAARDGAWDAQNVALGDASREATLHRAENLSSSSFLAMLDAHRAAAPDANYTGDVTVSMTTLDAVYATHAGPSDRTFLKLDVQGFERHVLAGAEDALTRLSGLQVELSIVPLYDGAPSLVEVVVDLQRRGFTLMSLEPGFMDRHSGQLLQVDGLFFRDGESGRDRAREVPA